MVGSDFSAQEPRLLAAYSNEDKLINAFIEGKDPYATLGIGVYKNNYWDNMEHFEDGTPNVEGKKRRSICKKLLLGMMYGMGPKLLSENIGCSMEEAQKIVDDFNTGFPKIHSWILETEKNAKIYGYVEDFWGRRRRLPDLLKPEYEFEKSNNKDFNPLLYSTGVNNDIEQNIKNYYLSKLKNYKSYKEKEAVKSEALSKGIIIKDNGGFISRSQRQCVNARIQGGAATMTKKAMIAIDQDSEMQKLGFRLLIGVHDELIGECPRENGEEVAKRLSFLMRTCVPELPVQFKCDAEVERHWYDNEYSHLVNDEYINLCKTNSPDDAFKQLCIKYCESLPEELEKMINNN